ncbi:MAG: host attachment protein [Proteobacteria bacterium]|nr:host attachment protein [Pseudomonadota bacterium]
MRTEWVVLADANRARVFARVGNAGWQDIRDLTRTTHNEIIDGREVRLPAGMQKLKDVLGGGTDASKDFLGRLARDLRAARKSGEFDALVLVAPSDVLVQLQGGLDSATRRKLVATAVDDLVGLPVRDARREIARRF